MREIKFRAYAENAEVMVYQKDFFRWIDGKMMEFFVEDEVQAFYQMQENYGEMSIDEVPLYSTDDMVKIMQFTGLKDKNGVEIYEGDILKLSLMDWCGLPLDQFVVSSKAFHNDICYIAEIIKCAENDWVEVIGNIYEDQHLLEPTL